MKKLTLVLALLVSFGLVGAFAIDAAPVVDFSAEAEAVFGIDLNDEMSTGFTNSAEADISVTWVDETAANEGEGTYGWIEIEDIAIGLAADEATDTEATESDMSGIITAEIGDINARVYFSPAYLQISTAPGFDYNNAEALRIQAADDNDPVDSLGSDDLVASNGGIILGMDGLAGMIDVAFKIGSVNTYDKGDIDAGSAAVDGYFVVVDAAGDMQADGYGSELPAVGDTVDAYVILATDSVYWISEPADAVDPVVANTENEYVFGIDATITPMEMLSIGLGLVFSNVEDAGIALTLNPVLTMGALTAGLPVDVYMGKGYTAFLHDESEVDFELAPYVTYDLNEAGSNVGLWAFFSGSTVDTENDLTPSFESNATLDLKVSFDEVADGFVPGLETGLAFFAFDVLDASAAYDMALGLTFNASYTMGAVKPFVDVKWASKEGTLFEADDTLDAAMLMDDDSTFDSDTDVLTLEAGVDLTMIPNTTFTIKYASDNLADDAAMDYTSDGSGADIDKGQITFAAKVAY